MDRTGWSWGLDFLSVACTVPRPNPLWLFPLGLCEGQSVCATATSEHTWFTEQDYCDCGDHHMRHAGESVARIRLPAGCVPCDQEYVHRTLVGCVLYNRRITLSFPLVFVVLHNILTNIINFQTKKTKLRGLSPQAIYTDRLNDCRLSANLVPTLADRRCRVVSATIPSQSLISVF
jgi:hypothetical protein